MVTGGIVTVKDSSWLMSWTINRQPQFREQPKDHCLVWVYSLFTDKPGDYIKKPMRACTGKEICMEWLYHIGVPEDQIEELAEHSANTCLLYTSRLACVLIAAQRHNHSSTSTRSASSRRRDRV